MRFGIRRNKFPYIRCPYCYTKFAYNKVAFKAMTAFTSEELEEMTEDEICELFHTHGTEEAVIKGKILRKFMKREDASYKRFWKEYPGSEPEWDYKDYPIIRPEDKEMIRKRNGYLKDASGFVYGVIDCLDRKSKIRICPECHNELPTGYGKYPVVSIAVVGITNAGKTVYLSQLTKNFGKIFAKIGMSTFPLDSAQEKFLRENPVKKGAFLPSSTLPEQLSEPLFFTIQKDKQIHTLILYDIAGENCVNQKKMEKYGEFIRHSDAIIMLLDPIQFLKPEEDSAAPEIILGTMKSVFLDMDNKNGKTNVPLAVVFSKGDILRDMKTFSEHSALFENKIYGRGGLKEKENEGKELETWISERVQGKPLLENLRTSFHVYNFFLVSALDCDVEESAFKNEMGEEIVRRKPVVAPGTLKLEEPLFWILEKTGVISSFKKKKKGIEKF